MRAMIVLTALALAAAGSASAQIRSGVVGPYFGAIQGRDAELTAQAQAARTRDIVITNELSRLDAQAQSNAAVSNLQAARITPSVPTVVLGPNATLPVIDARKLVSIPDAALAQSNARVRAAADNRR
jgi:hypothetical protein